MGGGAPSSSLSEKGRYLFLPYRSQGPLFSTSFSRREGVVGLLPSLSERALFQKRCEGAGRRPALFQRRDDASSSLIEVRGPSSLPPFFAEKGWLAFPLSFR